MSTVHDLTTQRDKVRDEHLAATKAERDALSDQIADVHRLKSAGRIGAADAEREIAKLRSKRDALRDAKAGQLGALEAKLSAARRLERDKKLAQQVERIAETCATMTLDDLEKAERAMRAQVQEAQLVAGAYSALLNERRALEASDKTVSGMSKEQRAALRAALERADSEDKVS